MTDSFDRIVVMLDDRDGARAMLTLDGPVEVDASAGVGETRMERVLQIRLRGYRIIERLAGELADIPVGLARLKDEQCPDPKEIDVEWIHEPINGD